MALMTVYFDDSGTHKESEYAVAACFVSDVKRWLKLDNVWREVLSDAGILDDGFHMAEFVAREKPFVGWSESKRKSVIVSLVDSINSNALGGFVSVVVKSDYDALVTGKLREKLGRFHYTFAVQSCLAYLEVWRRQWYMDQPMDYEFDTVNEGKHEIIDLFDDIGKRKIATSFGIEPHGYGFRSSKRVFPLQAADILAWEGNKHMRDSQMGGKVSRLSFKSMVDKIGISGRFFDSEHLTMMVTDLTKRYEAINWDGPLGGFVPLP